MTINDLVEEVLREKIRGEEFFTEIDRRVAHRDYIAQLLGRMVEGHEHDGCTENYGIVVSGKFGLYFYAYLVNQGYIVNNDLIICNGDLRTGEPCISLESYKDHVCSSGYIFIDDSYYSGKTRRAVEEELAKIGGKVVDVYVAYDGSHEKDPMVKSLYRYFDYHSKDGNKL